MLEGLGSALSPVGCGKDTDGDYFEYSEYIPCFTVDDQSLALANMTQSDGVSPSPKGGQSRLGPPLNPPLGRPNNPVPSVWGYTHIPSLSRSPKFERICPHMVIAWTLIWTLYAQS